MATEASVEEWWDRAGQFDERLEREFKNCFDDMNFETERARRGRAAIFGEGASVRQFGTGYENIIEFRRAVEETRKAPAGVLIVLEDPGKAWVEVLGSVLEIPIYFFALHWAMPLKHLTGDVRLPVGQSPERHFILPYQQVLPFRITASDAKEFTVFSNSIANRDISRGKRSLDKCVQLASYWGAKTQNGRWIAVLLLDPYPRNPEGFWYTVDSWPYISRRFWKRPPHADLRALKTIGDRDYDKPSHLTEKPSRVLSSTTGAVNIVSDDHRSILQQLIDAWAWPLESDVLGSSTPLAATRYIRRLVLAQATFLVQRSLFDVNKLTMEAALDTKRIGEFNMRDIRESGWSGEWKGKFYTQIWELRENLQQTSHMLKQTQTRMQRIGKIESLRNKKQSDQNNQETAPDILEYGIEKNACDEWEWEDVHRSLDFGLEMLDRTRDTYVEAVGATAAKLANDQAISSRRISGYAAIFVPASLTAAVLAIPAFTADDNSKFWIFWVVSVPLALLVWVWYMTGLQGWLKQTRKDIKQLREEARRDNHGSTKLIFTYLRELNRVTVGLKTKSKGLPAQLANKRRRGSRGSTEDLKTV